MYDVTYEHHHNLLLNANRTQGQNFKKNNHEPPVTKTGAL